MSKIYKQNCRTCNKQYEGWGKMYCSKECMYNDPEREATAKKIWKKRKAHGWISPRKGISPSNLSSINANKKGSGNPMWGKTTSDKQKQAVSKMSRAAWSDPVKSLERRKKMSKAQKGEKGSNWKGGTSLENKIIRRSIEFRLWRESVFARDNGTCQRCGKRGGKLHPHHILNFSDHVGLRFAIDNGITLCEKHHKEFHNIYKTKNNNKEQLNEYLYDN